MDFIEIWIWVTGMENAEALVVATKETGLEVNADKTKYMVMSRDRNAGRFYQPHVLNLELTLELA